MFQEIKLSDLVPSMFNYRKKCDFLLGTLYEKGMEELTASVKERGILEPIIVRPLSGKKKGKFEVVAGSRRHRAAIAAKIGVVPAIVKELSDEEALEVQIVENSQREDPNPIDEAFGFKRLLDMGHHTPDTLAVKLNKSIAYVLGRVKLADLDGKVQERVSSGGLSLGHAILCTRLRNPEDQREFMREVVDRDWSVREAADQLDRYCMKLKDAVFDTLGCASCASRSRNQTALFPELKKTDECADSACFVAKTQEHWSAVLEGKKAQGFKTFKAAKKVDKMIEAREAVRIAPSEKEAGYTKTYPPHYEDKCSGCVEHHAFCLVTNKNWRGGEEIEYGELCLDNKCLDAMTRAMKKEMKKEKRAASAAQEEPQSQATCHSEQAIKCRDRFLIRRLDPAKIEDFDVLQKELLLYLLVQWDISWDDDAYSFVAGVPTEHLDAAFTTAFINEMKNVDGDDLLKFLSAKDTNLLVDFAIDREYLESSDFKKKDDLVKLAEELDLVVIPTSAKAEIIEQILAYDLKGKVPREIAEVLKAGEEDVEPDTVGTDHARIHGEESPDGPESDPTMPVSTKPRRKKK